jgi:hypothetical protein
MALNTVSFRAGTLALVEETSGPKAPTAGTDFTAIQSDITMSPGLETLSNEELKNSIIPGKSIIGRESPTFSLSHYFRAGENSNLPDYNQLMKSAFGSVNEVASETDIASVVDAITFDLTDGTGYQKGDTLLVQDSVIGFELRPIAAISGNTVTLAFALSAAPQVGSLVGKPRTYNAVNDSNLIPTFSAWYYLPDTIELISGCRIEGVDINFSAGELINASFSGSGLGFYFDPLVIEATNKFIDVDVSASEYAASIPEGTYKDPHQVAEAIENALNANGSGVLFVVTYNDDGKYTITGDAAFTLLATTGASGNSLLPTIGFTVDAGPSTSETSDSDISLDSGFTPVYDDADPIAAKGHVLLIGNATDNICVNASTVDFSLANTKADYLDICAESGVGGSGFNSREATVSVSSYLKGYEAKYFKAMRTGQTVSMFYGAGEKSGGQFVKNKCASVYLSHATITSLEIADQDGVAQLNMELAAYAPEDSTQPVFAGFC